MVHRAHRAGDLTDTRNRGGRRDAWHPIGCVGEPEERHAVTVACVEEEVLTHAAGQVERFDQRHAEHTRIEVDGLLHVRAHQRHMVDAAELELGIGIVGLDHVAKLLPRSRSESNIRFRCDQCRRGRTVTVSPREQLPTLRGRQTQAAIDAAARVVIARKGFLATTISDIAAEAGKSTASFYNYYDSKERWSANGRCVSRRARHRRGGGTRPDQLGASYEAAAAHWNPTATGWPRSSACPSWP